MNSFTPPVLIATPRPSLSVDPVDSTREILPTASSPATRDETIPTPSLPDTESLSNPKKNRFYTSYGLVVKTQYPMNSVVMVERKLPYCVVNRLIRKSKQDIFNTDLIQSTTAPETPLDPLPTGKETEETLPSIQDLDTQQRCITTRLKRAIQQLDSMDFRENPCDFSDFVRYKFKLPFEDQYDFPHGQMQRRIKRFVSFTRGDGGSIPEKYAGFLTAFVEFEEETGYTFRFDFKMIQKQCREMSLQFTGGDGYDYRQHYYIIRVDKLYRLPQTDSQKYRQLGCSRLKQHFQREMDHLQYIPRVLKIQDAQELLIRQQEDIQKMDYKHTLLNDTFYEDKWTTCHEYLNLQNDNSFEDEEEEEEEAMCTEANLEKRFLNFVRRHEPDIYKRCVRQSKWRDKSQ